MGGGPSNVVPFWVWNGFLVWVRTLTRAGIQERRVLCLDGFRVDGKFPEHVVP